MNNEKWNGPEDGLPPPGTRCEASTEGNSLFVPVEVIAYNAGDVWLRKHSALPGNINVVRSKSKVVFRSIRTGRDKAIEAIKGKVDNWSSMNNNGSLLLASEIYSALREDGVPDVACKPEPFRGELMQEQEYYILKRDGSVKLHKNMSLINGAAHVADDRVFLTRRDAMLFAAFECND